jgi:hypothetical protein
MKGIHVIFIFTCLQLLLNAQKIGHVDYSVEDHSIRVRYDLLLCPSNHAYNLQLTMKDTLGRAFCPVAVKGDLLKVYPGRNKHIVWNVLKDTLTLKGNFSAEVDVVNSCSTRCDNGPKCALASAMLPGLGDYAVYDNAGPAPLAIGTLYFGSIGFAAFNYNRYHQYKRGYLTTLSFVGRPHSMVTLDDAKTLKAQAGFYHQRFVQSLEACAAIWAFDIIEVAAKGAINQRRKVNRVLLMNKKYDVFDN